MSPIRPSSATCSTAINIPTRWRSSCCRRCSRITNRGRPMPSQPAGTAPKPSGVKIPELPPMDASIRGGAAGCGIERIWRRHRAAIDRQHVPASGVLAGISCAGANHAGAAACRREARCADASTRTLGHAHGAVLASQLKPPRRRIHCRRAEILPAVCRTSDRPHDRAVRADPPRHARVRSAPNTSTRIRPRMP